MKFAIQINVKYVHKFWIRVSFSCYSYVVMLFYYLYKSWPCLTIFKSVFFSTKKNLNFLTNLLEIFEESTNCCWDTVSESFLWILKILSNLKRRYLCKYATMSKIKVLWNYSHKVEINSCLVLLIGLKSWKNVIIKRFDIFWLSYCCLLFGDVEIIILLNLTVVWFSLQKQVRIV